MTDTTTTHSAVDAPEAPALPGAEGGQNAQGTGDDLDKLLAEYDSTNRPPAAPQTPPAQQPGAVDDLKALADEVRGLRTERQQETFRRDMDVTIKNIRGELPSDYFDDAFVESWIDAQARQDPRLSSAWNNRHANPKQFEKVVQTLGRAFDKKYGKLPDKSATDDHAAVTDAVRGASTRAPESPPPNYGKLSDSDLQKEKDRLFGR